MGFSDVGGWSRDQRQVVYLREVSKDLYIVVAMWHSAVNKHRLFSYPQLIYIIKESRFFVCVSLSCVG